MLPSYPLVFGAGSADGVALANSIVATSIMPPSSLAQIAGGALQVGSYLQITLFGRISTVVTTPGTLTLDLRLGGVIVSAFGAMALNVVAQTNGTFEAVLRARIGAIGSGTSALALCMGKFVSRALIGSPATGAGDAPTRVLPDTAPANGTGFASATAVSVDVFATWSVANAANSIQVHHALVELKL